MGRGDLDGFVFYLDGIPMGDGMQLFVMVLSLSTRDPLE